MNITVHPGRLRGAVTVPPSKSLSHRALIAAYLSGGTVENAAENDDTAATRACLHALPTGDVCDCRESGSTLRFLMPLALVLHHGGIFTGSPRLLERSLQPFFALFSEKGVSAERADNRIILRGTLAPGQYALPGNVSSQFVTGLLFALPLLPGDSEIVLTSPLESAPYVALTLQVLEAFGVMVRPTDAGYGIPGGQAYRPCRYTVEGDESAAAFWLVANALGSEIACTGLNPESLQGDRVIRELIGGDERVIDARACPDLAPILAVLCCFRAGEYCIVNAERLRDKESDRLAAIAAELNTLGARVTERPDGLVIQAVPSLTGGEVDAHNDHRIAMSLAIAATRCAAPVVIRGAECVAKSYPAFFEHFSMLGGQLS